MQNVGFLMTRLKYFLILLLTSETVKLQTTAEGKDVDIEQTDKNTSSTTDSDTQQTDSSSTADTATQHTDTNESSSTNTGTKQDKDKVCLDHMSRIMRKAVLMVSDQVRHKPGCKTTEDG